MKKYLCGLLILSLLSACADSLSLDRTKKDASILVGTDVESQGYFAKNVVLITHDLEMTREKPLFFGLCTGFILDERTVLTAAHCLDKGTSQMKIVLNPNPRLQALKADDVYSVVLSIVHPTYSYHQMFSRVNIESEHIESYKDIVSYSDIALLRVDHDFPNQKSKVDDELGDILVQKNYDAHVVGFGKTTDLKNTSAMNFNQINGVLKETALQIDQRQITSDHFSLSQWKKPGVCKGDSGAPVFMNQNGRYKLFAIATGVYSQSEDYYRILDSTYFDRDECAGYGVYLNIESLKPWILKAMKHLKKKN